jgi:hypothetical protein
MCHGDRGTGAGAMFTSDAKLGKRTAAERSRRANLSEGDALILTDKVRDVRIRARWHDVFPTCVGTLGGLHACSPGSC